MSPTHVMSLDSGYGRPTPHLYGYHSDDISSCDLLQEDGCSGNTPSIAIFSNLLSYSNGIHGLELSVVGHVQLVRFKVADNRDNGMEIQETHGDWGGPLIKVCMKCGTSDLWNLLC